MSNHLYVLRCNRGADDLMIPCIGDDELEQSMIEHRDAQYLAVTDVDEEISKLVRNCHLEGTLKGWWPVG